MSQILKQKNDFVLFDEPYTIHRKIPYSVSFQNKDSHFPPDNVLENGSEAVRTYWNNKNLRKRIEVKN